MLTTVESGSDRSSAPASSCACAVVESESGDACTACGSPDVDDCALASREPKTVRRSVSVARKSRGVDASLITRPSQAMLGHTVVWAKKEAEGPRAVPRCENFFRAPPDSPAPEPLSEAPVDAGCSTG